MEHKDLNLLDEALGLHNNKDKPWPLCGRFVLVEDCVDTSGAFVLHHIIKRSLSSHSSSSVVFLAFSHPFSHYDRILRKLVFNSLSLSLYAFVFAVFIASGFLSFMNCVSCLLIKMFDLCHFCLWVLIQLSY